MTHGSEVEVAVGGGGGTLLEEGRLEVGAGGGIGRKVLAL